MSAFESLQQQFATKSAEITNAVLRVRREGENSSLITGVQKSFEETKQCLAQMEIEIRKLSIEERRVRQKHYEGFVEEMRRLETEFRKAKRGAFGDDEVNIDLFEAESEDGDSNTKLLPDSNSSRKLCLESEELGSKIMNSLSEKRDTIGKSRERLRKSNYDLGNSSKIANMILRKAMHNKLMIYTVFIVLLLLVLVIVYRKVFSI